MGASFEPVLTPNFTTIGTPSISDYRLDLNVKGAIRTPTKFTPSTNTWSIEIPVFFNAIPSGTAYRFMFSNVESPTNNSNATTLALWMRSGSAHPKIRTTAADSMSGQNVSVATGLNTIEFSFNGSTYYCKNLKTGSTQSAASTDKVAATFLFFGNNKDTNSVDGYIDLKNVKVKINGSTWWTPYT